MNAVVANSPGSARPWWKEMIRVDFRHAFWPWLVFAAAIISMALLPAMNEPNEKGIDPLILWYYFGSMSGASAFLSAIFCADYSDGTMATLITFPRNRNRIWWIRAGFAITLLVSPFLISAILMSVVLRAGSYSLVKDAPELLTGLLFFAYCLFGVAALLSLLLRKVLLVGTATLISPLILLLAYLLISNLFHIEWGKYSTPDRFPYTPVAYPIMSFTLVTIFFLLAWRLWLRMEVRS